MSNSEVQPQAGHLDQLSDTVAAMVAHLLQEQLAPIVETLREHARLLDCHTALLNHGTIMSRYNVGKLDDLRDLQNSVNYKLQYGARPEKRQYPTYRNPLPPSGGVRRTATVVDVAYSLLGDCPRLPDRAPGPSGEPSSSQSTEPTNSPPTTNAPNVPARQATPSTEPATTPPPSPVVAPRGNRRLRRERPFGASETADDPMWTTSRAIDIDARLPTPPPPPPYVLPPAYTDEDNAGVQNIMQATTATAVPRTSPLRSVPPTPAAGAEQAAAPTPSANTQTAAAVNVNGRQSQSPSPSSSPSATASRPGAISDDGQCAGPSSQVSNKAAGKKRRRHDDDDGSDDAEASPGASGSGSQSRGDEPEHKRVKMDPATSTERLPIPEVLLDVARRYPYPDPTLKERRYEFERLKSLRSLFRPGGEYY
ncbi:hypothetical protein BJV78DRAFT_739412 [Lactifluus subvellereus]|nr:hypothetical protein BJV78DRAFT_739412 [Lactifluus subvellereus]